MTTNRTFKLIHIVAGLGLLPLLSLMPGPAQAQMVYPVSGRVSSEYGPRSGGFHYGLDIAVPERTFVGGSYPGSMRLIHWENASNHSQGYGWHVHASHRDSYETVYAHLVPEIVLSQGASFTQNQTIAKSGNTGSSTGPHVHFEVQYFGAPVFVTGQLDSNVTRGARIPENYPPLPPVTPPNPHDCVVINGFAVKYTQLGGANSRLGYCIANEVRTADDGGAYQNFEHGALYWQSGTTPSYALYGDILNRWRAIGGVVSVLGYPRSDEISLGTGAYNDFVNGSMHWSSNTGSHYTRGAIREKWRAGGGANGSLGYPTTDETSTGTGAYNDFYNGASIYWSEATDAHIVKKAIRTKWRQLGGARGSLGYPVTDEIRAMGGQGSFNDFQNGNSIYWSEATDAHVIRRDIREKWRSLGGPTSLLGYPTTDEIATGDGGAYNDFANDASIYWSPATDSHYVRKAIRGKWKGLGAEKSCLGYPTSDEYATSTGARNDFQGGYILWTRSTNATVSSCK